jgi:integrase
MSVKKVGENKFEIDVHLRNVPRKYKIFHGTRMQAEDEELRLKKHQKVLRNNKGDALTSLSDVLWHYFYYHLMRKPSHKRQKNVNRSKSHIENILSFIGDVSVLDEDKFAKHLEKSLMTLEEQELYQKCRDIIIILHAAFEKAIRKRLLPYEENPIIYDMSYIPDNERKWIIITREQFEKLLQVLPPYLHPIVWMAYLVPMRIDELRNLLRQDVNLNEKTGYLKWTKNGHPRFIPIPTRLESYFRHLPKETNYIFFMFQNNKFHPLPDICEDWHEAVTKIGLPELRFHDLRATAARNMVLLGMRKEIVAKIGGWVTIATFEKFYRRIQTSEIIGQWHRYERIRESLEKEYGSIEDIHLGEGNTPFSTLTLNSSTDELYGPKFLSETNLNSIK